MVWNVQLMQLRKDHGQKTRVFIHLTAIVLGFEGAAIAGSTFIMVTIRHASDTYWVSVIKGLESRRARTWA